MAVWASTDFTGGAVGVNPTTTTEPIFTSSGGTAGNLAYNATVPSGVAGQSVQGAGARSLIIDTTGRTRWRAGMWVNRVSGTQSAGQALILLRSTTTNRADLFLRNQNGGQLALRQGVSGTTYIGQSATVIGAGEDWYAEVEYNSDGTTHNVYAYIWQPGNATATPTETWSGTTEAAVDNVSFFNPTGTTGLTMRFAGLRVSDGEQIRSAAQPIIVISQAINRASRW